MKTKTFWLVLYTLCVPPMMALANVLVNTPADKISISLNAHSSGWQSTNISVTEGQEMTFTASGSVIHWKSQDQSLSKLCGPDGTGGIADENYLAPGCNVMSLVGCVGSCTFNIGSSSTVRMPATGTLFLGMNETLAGGWADNEGYWSIEIVSPATQDVSGEQQLNASKPVTTYYQAPAVQAPSHETKTYEDSQNEEKLAFWKVLLYIFLVVCVICFLFGGAKVVWGND